MGKDHPGTEFNSVPWPKLGQRKRKRNEHGRENKAKKCRHHYVNHYVVHNRLP
jgi:hypothetical protein